MPRFAPPWLERLQGGALPVHIFSFIISIIIDHIIITIIYIYIYNVQGGALPVQHPPLQVAGGRLHRKQRITISPITII